jgi:hypothetical protein
MSLLLYGLLIFGILWGEVEVSIPPVDGCRALTSQENMSSKISCLTSVCLTTAQQQIHSSNRAETGSST